ncbi:MAG: hypothetical protein EOM52_01660 [Clostridia bacterium]|nr:hypothetical protein [Clostridia bacterium]
MRHKKLGGALIGLAAFLLLSGGLLTLAGMAMGGKTSLYGFGIPRQAYVESADKSETNSAAFQKIAVDVPLGNVYLTSGDSYGVKLVWENENNKLYSEITDGKLRVWSENGTIIDARDYHASVYIYFPHDAQFEDVNVKTSLGELSLEGFTAKNLTAKSDLGEVTLSDVTAGRADLRLSLGDLNGDGVTVGGRTFVKNKMGNVSLSGSFRDMDVECDMGRVTIDTDRPKSDYSYDLKTSMGNITLDGDRQSSENAEGGSGTYKLKVDNSMGNVDIIFG